MNIKLEGRIDANNAPQIEKEIITKLEKDNDSSLTLDMEKLEYISSAGLRILLNLKKDYTPDIRLTNVSSEIYEIMDMTGFTELMTVEKAYRVVSVEGCKKIGQGANGTIYCIDQDNVVKVYNNADALADIQHEREVAKLALILGIPTAISYDVVKVGDSYGSVFEMLNASSFAEILANEPEKFDWCVEEYVKMLQKIHGTLVPEGKLPDMKETALSWAKFMLDYLPETAAKKLVSLVEAVPHDDHMIHGDYHTKNLELTQNEVLLIDMDTLAVGHPIFELASMYNSFVGYSEYDHEIFKKFQGFDREIGVSFWKKSLAAYLGTDCETKIREVEDKARIIGYTRMIRRSIRRNGLETEKGRAEINLWKEELLELLERTDTLVFSRNELDIRAENENLPEVQKFAAEHLAKVDCPPATAMQIGVAIEEIFINISNYAYTSDKGNTVVRVEVSKEPVSVSITFIDHGIPYDPLKKEDPDITLSAEERKVGGLGIFMTKKIMDDVAYKYVDGKNILTLKKNL